MMSLVGEAKLESGAMALHQSYFVTSETGVEFPSGFKKGVAYSTYQNSGHNYWPSLGYRPQSNWTWFENEHTQRFNIARRKSSMIPGRAVSPIDFEQKVGISAHTWAHLFEDIELMKALHVNSVRFELPWADLQPVQGAWNEEAFALFDRYIDTLIAQGIAPMITLYHWVHPLWLHEMGGWQKEENITYFVDYCAEVFRRYGHKVHYWCTINEPTVISACGYLLGTHAPGIKDNKMLAGMVLNHLLKAHVEVYHALKAMPHGNESQICIVHQASTFEPYMRNYFPPLNVISQSLSDQFNHAFAHKVVMYFFKTGIFYYRVSDNESVYEVNDRAKTSLDFFGLNFYASITLGPWPTHHDGETPTDMVWAIRPHSLYQALKEIAHLGVPIIITENGIPDAKDDRRAQWIVGYVNAAKKAFDEGVDLRGFYYWSLLDNYEWNMGHDKKFGLYEVNTLSMNPDEKQRRLRKGSEMYRDYMRVGS
jgi:Beta-glucosidase/6-phospho-beta-glucosidase/beta-galactosidase